MADFLENQEILNENSNARFGNRWGKIKRTYKNRRGSRRIFNLHNYDGRVILSQFAWMK